MICCFLFSICSWYRIHSVITGLLLLGALFIAFLLGIYRILTLIYKISSSNILFKDFIAFFINIFIKESFKLIFVDPTSTTNENYNR